MDSEGPLEKYKIREKIRLIKNKIPGVLKKNLNNFVFFLDLEYRR